MRRLLTIGLASLVATALMAPAVRAATQIRNFQGTLQPVGAPQRDGGQIGLDIVFKNKRQTPRKFTPRQLVAVSIQGMPMTCANTPGQGNSEATLTATLQAQAKLKSFPPASGKPKRNRYSYRFVTTFSGFTGVLSGKVFKRQGRGEVIANGSLRIDDIDFPGGSTNCSTAGPRGWSAFSETRPPPPETGGRD
jgi:hypothetical protein